MKKYCKILTNAGSFKSLILSKHNNIKSILLFVNNISNIFEFWIYETFFVSINNFNDDEYLLIFVNKNAEI